MRTHCPRGHALTPENLVSYKAYPKRRECRTCKTSRRHIAAARQKLKPKPRPVPVAHELSGPLTRAQLQAERAASAERRRIRDDAGDALREIEERYCEIAAKRLSQTVLDFGGTA